MQPEIPLAVASRAAQRETMKLWDGEISYLEWGSSGPSLLFSHATGFNAETYRALLEPLSARFHVYATDQRGHGFTSLPPLSPQDWIIYRDDTLRFLDGLDGRPMILAGHSMGAIVSVMAALLRPDLVRGLVLVEPVFVPGDALTRLLMSWNARLGNSGPSLAERAVKRRAEFDSLEAAQSAYQGRGAFRSWPNEMLRDYLKGGLLPMEDGRVRLACSPAWEAETFRSTPIGAAKLSRGLRCPAAIVYGGMSTTCSDAQARLFARGRKGTRRVRVAKATHFLPMEYPHIVRAEIERMADTLGV